MSAHAHCASPQSALERRTSWRAGAREPAQPVAHARRLPRTLARRRCALRDQPCHTPHSPAHTPLLRQPQVSRRSLGIISSIIPARARPQGPQTRLAPRRAPRHPRARGFGRRWVPGAGCAPSHLAAGAAARGAHSTARLLWRRSPRNRRRHRHGRRVQRGDTPGAGRAAAAHSRSGRDSWGLLDQANGSSRACRSPGGLGGAARALAEVLTAAGALHAGCPDPAGLCGCRRRRLAESRACTTRLLPLPGRILLLPGSRFLPR